MKNFAIIGSKRAFIGDKDSGFIFSEGLLGSFWITGENRPGEQKGK
ncbi:hypothetical protein C943_00477 [Mariniradius saccharolyticus AK6]|uniref:Uncharacterized protein n=1 Tax=Mariniradius saccharolyticus AK6 TaxID=1239962 RepID=M7X6Y4_9BACT|nr:hypothetical protein C943_00477 [Mariniradius saccharolyticus AK6]